MDRIISIMVLVLGVFISSFIQVVLKKTANKHHIGIKQYLNKSVIISNAVFFMVSITSLFAYRYVELSTGAFIGALGYVFVPLLGYFFLKEKFTYNMVFGTIFIIGGVVVYSIWR